MIEEHDKQDLAANDTYEGKDLGVTIGAQFCQFKVWAPDAVQMEVLLYPAFTAELPGGQGGTGEQRAEPKEFLMERQQQGIWFLKLDGEWNGCRYMYRATFKGGRQETAVDPYARAVTMNGEMGVIIRLKETDPPGWSQDVRPELKSPVDAVLYELHVRDFSIHSSSGMVNKGKYLAFTETGLCDAEGNTLGIDHLAELGITHVHLLPVFDFATVDESKAGDSAYGDSEDSSYNWGYDPLHYNVPEGSYATRADEPGTRIRELKALVLALHQRGIGVIMDVVYNHTFNTADSSFEKLVPGYYYRQNADGTYSNGSGTGNEVASERPMVRKFILESVCYWAEEYHIDGFRFDLMGLIDTTTMRELAAELHEHVSPSILLYGEPWAALDSPLGERMTLKGDQKRDGLAVFNDNYRGAIKGDSDGAEKGFATGAEGKEEDIWTGVRGAITDFTASPSETVNYVTVHDNLNLWDKVVHTQGLEDQLVFISYDDEGHVRGYDSVEQAVQHANPYMQIDPNHVLENETVRRCLLANGIVLTSQGIPLLAAGDEFLRSKYGDANSHQSGDAVNAIRWEQKQRFKPVFDYYRGLIRLRLKHAAFRLRTREDINQHVSLLKKDKSLLAYELSGKAAGDSWDRIIVIYNAAKESRILSIPRGMWNIVVEQGQAGLEPMRTVNDGEVSVPPISLMVMYANN